MSGAAQHQQQSHQLPEQESSYLNRRQRIHAAKERLQKWAALPANKLCSDCPEANPTWASLLEAPPLFGGGKRLAVLCCYSCSKHHYSMGKQVCTVKSIKMVDEWTETEIDTMEQSGGNQIVNALYEAKLDSTTSGYDKWVVSEDEEEEEDSRREFVHRKYRQLEYFDPALYQAHFRRRPNASSPSDQPPPRPRRSTRRCRSFEEQTFPVDRRKNFVRKPMRRRSQSFEFERVTDEESTDDDQRLSYNLPGYLTGKNKDATGKQREQRRSSMPGLAASSSSSSRTNRRPRRSASKDTSLGYGEPPDLDSTRRRSNRRGSMSNSSRRCSSGRRASMPTVGVALDVAPVAPVCNSRAPKMPTRCVSDDSGEDTEVDDDNDGFTSPPPASSAYSPPRTRRMSMPNTPVMVVSDEDDDSIVKHAYSPALSRSAPLMPDPAVGCKSPYGINLGYGFEKNSPVGEHDNPQPSKAIRIRPTRMPRLALPGNKNGFKRSTTAPANYSRTPKLLDSPGSGFSSCDELGYSVPVATMPVDVMLVRRRRRMSNLREKTDMEDKERRNHHRMMRRCSTGGALDQLYTVSPGSPLTGEQKQTRRQSNCEGEWGHFEDSDATTPKAVTSKRSRAFRRSSTGGGLPTMSVSSTDHTSYQLKSLVSLAAATASESLAVSTPNWEASGDDTESDDDDDVDHADTQDHRRRRPVDLPPSNDDLGYGGGQESLSSCGFMDLSLSREDLGYGDEAVFGGAYSSQHQPPPRASRRASASATMNPIAHRRSSTRAGDDGNNAKARPRTGRRSSVGACIPTTTSASAAPLRADRHCSVGGFAPWPSMATTRRHKARSRRRSSVAGRSSAISSPESSAPQPRSTRRSSVAGASTEPTKTRRRCFSEEMPPPLAATTPCEEQHGRHSLVRTDSTSCVCSEVSEKAALLSAGDEEFKNPSVATNREREANKGCSGNLDKHLKKLAPSDSLMSVSVVAALGYRTMFAKRDPLASSAASSTDSETTNPADSSSSEHTTDDASTSNPTSKKDLWEAKLENSPTGNRKTGKGDGMLSTRRRRTRRTSMTNACA